MRSTKASAACGVCVCTALVACVMMKAFMYVEWQGNLLCVARSTYDRGPFKQAMANGARFGWGVGGGISFGRQISKM